MKLSIDDHSPNLTIQQCTEQGFQIDRVWHPNSILLCERRLIPWHIEQFQLLDQEVWRQLLRQCQDEFQIEILILGTGSVHQFIPESWTALFWEQKIGIEVMNTPAGCRTYNLLSSENRKVAAALISGA